MDASYLTGQPVIWDGTVLPLVGAWAEGKDLSEILNMFHSNTDISGSLISGFSPRKRFIKPAEGRLDRLPSSVVKIVKSPAEGCQP